MILKKRDKHFVYVLYNCFMIWKKEENYIKRTREALGFFLTLINKKTNPQQLNWVFNISTSNGNDNGYESK